MKLSLLPAVLLCLYIAWGKESLAQSPPIETALIVSLKASRGAVPSFQLTADYVQMLTGKAAIAAARSVGEADYEIRKKRDTVWSVPNDYFVLNQSPKTRMLSVAPKAKIFLVAEGSSKVAPAPISKLQKSFAGKLFRLTISNGGVEKIEEIYTP